MVELISSWLSRVLLWNEREWLEFRDSLPGVIFMPLIFIVPGAFLGFLGEGPKQWILEIGIAFVWYYLARLLWRRAPFSIGVGTVAETATSKESGIVRRVGAEALQATEKYLQLAGAILASELVVGFIAFWTPAHQFPRMAILAFFGIGAIVFWSIWQWSGRWWRKIVFALAIFTTAAALFAVFMPQTFGEISTRTPLVDRCAAARIRGGVLPEECQARTTASAVSRVSSRDIVVGSSWVRFELPPFHFGATAPMRTISLQTLDGKEFVQEPGGMPHRVLADGSLSSQDGMGNDVPCCGFNVRSADGNPTHVSWSVWPK